MVITGRAYLKSKLCQLDVNLSLLMLQLLMQLLMVIFGNGDVGESSDQM